MNFLLNTRSGILHRYPANEACNTDQIADRDKLMIRMPLPLNVWYERDCKRCFPA